MENGALHVARGTLGDRNASQRCQMDPKGRPKGAKGTQNGAKGCQKGAKGTQIGAKWEPKSSPKSTKKRSRCILGEKGGIKVPKMQNIGITTPNLGLKNEKNWDKK